MKRPSAAAAALILSLTACATPDRVVLLPDENNNNAVGKLNVSSKGGDTLLDSAYDTAAVSGSDAAARSTSDPAQVREDFGTVLAALPRPPQIRYYKFQYDSADLLGDQKAELLSFLRQVADRPEAEVVIIGHTDTVGSDAYNDDLSLKRAEAVKNELIALKVPAAHISVAGRGKRELRKQTADNVEEPENRVVEIEVR